MAASLLFAESLQRSDVPRVPGLAARRFDDKRHLGQRREQFTERYLRPLLTEATRLGIDAGELVKLISDFARQQAGETTASPARGGVPV